ncbi:MAG: DUF1905 domain-containing protein [Candidatus Kapaibacterium sp.]|nr:MAG: DUF1905 domain-containing protein [Candidatus Kapabacteria bacterium]
MKKNTTNITQKSPTNTVKSSLSAQEIREYETVLLSSTSNNYLTLVHVPNDVAEAFKNEGVKRVVACLVSNKAEHEYQCGLLPVGEGNTGIMINKKIRTKLSIGEGSRLLVRLRADESEYGLEMPEELAELMNQDEDGSRLFHALTKGKQRTLIYVVSSVKNSERRIERALTVVAHLKEHYGKIDFKRLYEDLKISHRFEE